MSSKEGRTVKKEPLFVHVRSSYLSICLCLYVSYYVCLFTPIPALGRDRAQQDLCSAAGLLSRMRDDALCECHESVARMSPSI